MIENYILGNVRAIYYENTNNLYKVLLIEIVEQNTTYTENEIVVTGTFGQIQTDTEYKFFGKIVEHVKYGVQFQVERYEQVSLTSHNGIVAYLSGDKFHGIGKVLAERIVEVLGDNVVEKIIADDALLKKVKGLTATTRQDLVKTMKSIQGENQTLITLLKYGFTDKLAYKIFQRYKEETIAILEENPYHFLETIEGIGFLKIDDIAKNMGIAADNSNRIKGAIFVTLRDLCYTSGYTYFIPDILLQHSLKLLEKSRAEIINEKTLANCLIEMIQVGSLIEDQKRIALPSLYYAEDGIVSALNALLKQDKVTYPTIDLNQEINQIEKNLGIQYSTTQKEAIVQAISSPIFILTGGPGTGKTTVLNGIVHLFAKINQLNLSKLKQQTLYDKPEILLAAPTGRAAKRMSELTGLNAVTLHRLLGIGITGDNSEIQDMYISTLEGSLLIIDEVSMVDTWLLNWVLKAIPHGMQVILVGDKYQLPSVGPGQVLHDLLESQKISFVELTEIYRQGSDSTIIGLAHQVKDGILATDFTMNYADRSYFECLPAQVPLIIEKVVTKAKEKGFSIRDIQVLAPMYKGVAGIDTLNKMIQNILNPKTVQKRELVYFEKVYRIGDKVLQLVNQPEQNIFNGDIGEIVNIFYDSETSDKQDEVIVSYDGNEVIYKKQELNNITLAYCCSIHKAQGSEFPLVILPMLDNYSRMLRRDLLYTAMTRSKKTLILCGQKTAFQKACASEVTYRQTLLLEKLTGIASALTIVTPTTPVHPIETHDNCQLTEDNWDKVDAMIGMDNITPYEM